MQLPGRLRLTTLGDLLGALYRAGASGVLELVEVQGVSAGRSHRVLLDSGLIEDVDSSFDRSRSSGILGRLESLFGLSEALVRFHVPRPRQGPRQTPLSPREFLHGRPRARARSERASSTGSAASAAALPSRAELVKAYRTLGLEPDADRAAVLRAFRRLAAVEHPDRHPTATAIERARLLRRFAELSAAYHTLRG
jgi:DnaJ domain